MALLAVGAARTMILLTAAVLATGKLQNTDEQYHSMPPLFRLDDYDSCLVTRGAYCLGSFLLRPRTSAGHRLFDYMQKYSEQEHSFNHTVLHRGYCLPRRCGDHPRETSKALGRHFERCVSARAEQQYGLEAKLLALDYCRRSEPPQPLDLADYTLAAVVGLLVALNVIGTIYDLFRDKSVKPHRYLLLWSLRVNYHRLTARHSGDPRLAKLESVQGIRAFVLGLVMLAHSVIAHHMAYIFNPEYIEKGNEHWLSTLFHNGSLVVQVFFVLSSFLFAFNWLIFLETQKEKPGLRLLPHVLLHRVIRILPLHLFTVGLTATWWGRLGGGALWSPLVERQAAACRRKWWTHALFLNNMLYTDDKCLLQSWFLAADMQVHVVCAIVTLWLAGRARGRAGGRGAARLLAGLALLAAAVNFCIAWGFQLRPIMMIMNPEVVRSQYSGSASFSWLYAAPWGSLPAALLGLAAAFHHHHTLTHPRSNVLKDTPHGANRTRISRRVFLLAYQLFLPAMVLWILGGRALLGRAGGGAGGGGPSRAGEALYAAVDRPVFALMTTVALLGFVNDVPSIWKSFFSWSGWRAPGRLALAVYLLHWNHHLTHLALRSQPASISVYEIGGHWHSVQVMSYATAIPLHLCLELPVQRTLEAFFFNK